jgi:hypothetical protein
MRARAYAVPRAPFRLTNRSEMMARNLKYDEKWEALVLGAIDASKTSMIHLVCLDRLFLLLLSHMA